MSSSQTLLKRFLDLVIAILSIFVLSPIMILTLVLVLMKMGTPAFFKQTRPGYMGVPFKMYKFRSMNSNTVKDGNLLTDEHRLTQFGKLLRSTSLDELPELFNVIKGDMSIVGPRPLLMQYLPIYSARQARRHDVKPGLTGWAQINGRNAISWDEKFDLDLWYVKNQSIRLDIMIIIKTIKAVLNKDGISQDGHATMHEFGL